MEFAISGAEPLDLAPGQFEHACFIFHVHFSRFGCFFLVFRVTPVVGKRVEYARCGPVVEPFY